MSNINGNHSNNKIHHHNSSSSSSSNTRNNIPSTISLNSFQTINKNNFYSQQSQQYHQIAPLTNASISNTNNCTEIEYSGIHSFFLIIY